MKKILTFLFISLFAASRAQVCNSSGDLMIFTNYDGGTLTINVDQNIPNLKIGVCSYEAIRIVLTGAFVSNVVAVRYAGYNGTNNTGCGSPSIPTTTIVGAPGTAATSTVFAPSSPLANSNGYGSIICGYSCSNNTNQGGCNTVDQIEAYFLGYFTGSSLFAHKVQYGCWTGTQSVSVGGTCCPPVSVLPGGIAGSQTICQGQIPAPFTSTAAASAGTAAVSYTWQMSFTSPSSGYTSIFSANTTTFAAGTVGQTTYYRRAASSGTGSPVYSNVITIVALAAPSMIFGPPNAGICPNGSVAINVVGASTFTWLPSGSNSQTLVVNAPGVYTVTGTTAQGCTATATKSVSAFPSPQISVSGPTAVCNNSAANWTASGASTYTWLPGNLVTQVLNIPTVTAGGTHTVYGLDANGCPGFTTFPYGLLPTPFVVAISSNPMPCIGDTLTLTASGAISYTWNPGNLSGTTVSLVAQSPIIFTITGMGANGCTNKTTLSLAPDPVPALTLSVMTQPVCSGRTATLTANGPFTSFYWSPGALTGAQVTFTPSQSVVYTVTAFGSCVVTNTLGVQVVPSPTLIVTSVRPDICKGEKSSLSVTGANTYMWSTPTSTSAATSITVTPAATTIYTVSGSTGNGCDSQKNYTVNVSGCTALDEVSVSKAGIEVYPNPNTGSFVLRAGGRQEYSIVNSIGQLIMRGVLVKESQFSANVTGLTPGIYFVILPDHPAMTRKIIVEN